MNTTTTAVFTNAISVTELGKLFKVAFEDIADILSRPSCISCSLTKQ